MRPTTVVRILSLAAAAIAALALSACGSGSGARAPVSATAAAGGTAALPGKSRPPVTIGDKNFTEQFVLGELYRQALAAQGFSTEIDRNIGPTDVTLQALQSGRLGMYPEYLGTWNTIVAGDPRTYSTSHGAYQAARRYAKAHGLELLSETPFSDVNAIGVTLGYAKQNGLHTIGSLAKVAPTLTLGAAPQLRQDQMGLPGIAQVYGVVPAAFKALDVGEQYQALAKGIVQAAYVTTTDGQLLSGQYALLSDPRRLFGWGNVVPVVPSKVLALEGPAFVSTVNAVSALLTTQTMRKLNAQVDVYRQDPAAVAKQFLQVHGLAPSG